MSENEKSKCLDTMGHRLQKGDWVTIMPPPQTIWIGRIEEISEGGLSVALDRNNKGMTPAKVRVVLDITMNANPNMPVFPGLLKTTPPGSDDVLDEVMKRMEESSKETPPSGKPRLV